jgi:hypothetical protein
VAVACFTLAEDRDTIEDREFAWLTIRSMN